MRRRRLDQVPHEAEITRRSTPWFLRAVLIGPLTGGLMPPTATSNAWAVARGLYVVRRAPCQRSSPQPQDNHRHGRAQTSRRAPTRSPKRGNRHATGKQPSPKVTSVHECRSTCEPTATARAHLLVRRALTLPRKRNLVTAPRSTSARRGPRAEYMYPSPYSPYGRHLPPMPRPRQSRQHHRTQPPCIQPPLQAEPRTWQATKS